MEITVSEMLEKLEGFNRNSKIMIYFDETIQLDLDDIEEIGENSEEKTVFIKVG